MSQIQPFGLWVVNSNEKKTQIDSQSYSSMGSYLIHRKSFLNAETCESEVSLSFTGQVFN